MKAKTLYICTFTNVDPGNEAWNLDALPAQDAQLESAAGNGTSDLIFKDGLSDMEGNVVSNLCYFKHPNFQDFLKAANAPAPPFVAIMGVFPDGKKRLFIVKSPQQVKIHIRAMWLGEFGGTTQMPTNLGEGEGGWGEGDGGLLCQLLPPLCALGFLPWLALAAYTTYRAAESRSTTGKVIWGTPAFLLWQGFFARGGVKQIQWWGKKAGIGSVGAKIIRLIPLTEKDVLYVSDIQLVSSSGQKIRIATKVAFKNGEEISFSEKLPKKTAIKNALYQLNKS